MDDAQLFSWVDRDAPELIEWLARNPGSRGRVDEMRRAVSRAREAARGVPERIGPYRVAREIGRGGMGVVYEADQPEAGRRVAIKVVSGADPTLAERFERECAALGRLNHPGIAHLYEAS